MLAFIIPSLNVIGGRGGAVHWFRTTDRAKVVSPIWLSQTAILELEHENSPTPALNDASPFLHLKTLKVTRDSHSNLHLDKFKIISTDISL